MSKTRDPLAGVELLLVDGTNLLHALRRGAGPAPPAAIIGRLRAAIPPAVRIELVFDGPPPPGSGGRIAHGVGVRYAGRVSADDHIRALVETAPRPAPGADSAILVVSDDAELRRSVRDLGAATARAGWLAARLERATLSAPSVGGRRPPRDADATTDGDGAPRGRSAPRTGGADRADDDDRTPWRPGRGATAKTGNPRRLPKRHRHRGPDGC